MNWGRWESGAQYGLAETETKSQGLAPRSILDTSGYYLRATSKVKMRSLVPLAW